MDQFKKQLNKLGIQSDNRLNMQPTQIHKTCRPPSSFHTPHHVFPSETVSRQSFSGPLGIATDAQSITSDPVPKEREGAVHNTQTGRCLRRREAAFSVPLSSATGVQPISPGVVRRRLNLRVVHKLVRYRSGGAKPVNETMFIWSSGGFPRPPWIQIGVPTQSLVSPYQQLPS